MLSRICDKLVFNLKHSPSDLLKHTICEAVAKIIAKIDNPSVLHDLREFLHDAKLHEHVAEIYVSFLRNDDSTKRKESTIQGEDTIDSQGAPAKKRRANDGTAIPVDVEITTSSSVDTLVDVFGENIRLHSILNLSIHTSQALELAAMFKSMSTSSPPEYDSESFIRYVIQLKSCAYICKSIKNVPLVNMLGKCIANVIKLIRKMEPNTSTSIVQDIAISAACQFKDYTINETSHFTIDGQTAAVLLDYLIHAVVRGEKTATPIKLKALEAVLGNDAFQNCELSTLLTQVLTIDDDLVRSYVVYFHLRL